MGRTSAGTEPIATGAEDLVVKFATTVGFREFARDAGELVAEVIETGCPALVTRNGVPVAAVVAIDPQDTGFRRGPRAPTTHG